MAYTFVLPWIGPLSSIGKVCGVFEIFGILVGMFFETGGSN